MLDFYDKIPVIFWATLGDFKVDQDQAKELGAVDCIQRCVANKNKIDRSIKIALGLEKKEDQ